MRTRLICLSLFTLLAGSLMWHTAVLVRQRRLSQQLISAVEVGDIRAIRHLLQEGADPNARKTTARISSGYLNRWRLLWKNAFRTEGDASAPTALMAAIQTGNRESIGLLIQHDADVNAGNSLGETACMRAAQMGHPDVVRLLLAKGADANVQDREGKTALMWAAGSESAECVRLLLESGADVRTKDREGATALSYVEQRPDITEMLTRASIGK